MSSPVLPRGGKVPKQFEVGSSTPEYPTTVQDYFRRTYFETLDLVLESIRRRFDQKDYMLQKLEVLLKSKSPMQLDINEVTEFYGSNLNKTRLESQLHILHASVNADSSSDHNLNSVIAYMKSSSAAQRDNFSEIVKNVKLISDTSNKCDN